MRYRRYYVDQKKDGSIRVVSTGPFATAAWKLWRGPIGTVFVFIVALSLFGLSSTPTIVIALVAGGLHLAGSLYERAKAGRDASDGGR